MVTHSRTTLRADQLRPLNRPKPGAVTARRGEPVAVHDGSHPVAVEQVQDRWRLDDEWWRQPIHRTYFTLLDETGRLRTLFYDAAADSWFAHR